MQDVTFHSAALGREMPYRVFLPANMTVGQQLPVVYLLHGGGGSFRDWSNDSNISQYALQGIILVMPEGNSSYFMNAVESTQDKYEDYVTQDLIADVEARFPAKKDRGAVKLVWFDGNNKIPQPADFPSDEKVPGTGGILFGDKGMIVHGSHGAGGCPYT